MASLPIGSCRAGDACISQDKCPGFLDLKEQFESATKGTDEWTTLLNRLKGLICNKRTKSICCSGESIFVEIVLHGDQFGEQHFRIL